MIRGPGTVIMLVVVFAMVAIGGATAGATQAVDGGERIDMYDRLHENTFTDAGEFRERDPPPTLSAAVTDRLTDRLDGPTPETPRQDQWVREHTAKPLVIAAFWVADAGFDTGYAMASTLGVGMTQAILNGALVSVLGGVGSYVYRVCRYVPP